MIFAAQQVAKVVLVVIFIAYSLSSYASATVHSCADSSISIRAEEPINHQEICNSATEALAFFDRLDMELSHPIFIEVVTILPDFMSKTAVGCYQQEKQKVIVLTFSEFEKRKLWFGVPVNRLMYSSLVTHEVSHAVASCNFKISEPTVQANEYIAYVAMFAMMNPVLRARILDANPGVGFESGRKINEIIYLFDPMRFGVEAYRHYLKKGNGDAFLLKTLSGKVLTHSAIDFP